MLICLNNQAENLVGRRIWLFMPFCSLLTLLLFLSFIFLSWKPFLINSKFKKDCGYSKIQTILEKSQGTLRHCLLQPPVDKWLSKVLLLESGVGRLTASQSHGISKCIRLLLRVTKSLRTPTEIICWQEVLLLLKSDFFWANLSSQKGSSAAFPFNEIFYTFNPTRVLHSGFTK